METMFLSDQTCKKLESFQGSLINRTLGLRKCIHHTELVQALRINTISDNLKKTTISLWERIFKVDSPVRDLYIFPNSV